MTSEVSDAEALLSALPHPWWVADDGQRLLRSKDCPERLDQAIAADQLPEFQRRWAEALAQRRPWGLQLLWQQRWHWLAVQPLDQGLWLGTLTDIGALRSAEARLHEADAVWKLALEATGDGVWDWYVQTGVELYSPGFLGIYGYGPEDIEPNPEALDRLTHPDDVEQMARDRQAHFEGRAPIYRNEHRVRCKDGSWKWVLSRGMVIARDAQGRPLRMVGTHTDITERKHSETLAWRQANYDALTDLPNRRLLAERLDHDIKKGQRERLRVALLALDLDHFKAVNDEHGHDAGDALLRQAAARIKACVREVDMVARLGGDEFIVLLAELGEGNAVIERVAHALVHSLAQPFELGAAQGRISASVGIALYPDDADDAATLFKRADQALYAAKGEGRQAYRYFTGALQDAARARARLGDELRLALARHEFRLRFQPILPAAGGRCREAEVLLRWQHPMLGLLGPNSFLALAESTGLIVEIGAWVLRQAAAQLRAWRVDLDPDLTLALNLSGTQLRHWGGSLDDWLRRLAALEVPGSGLVLDLREAQLRDPHLRDLLRLPALRAAGIGVALDDFGAGDSALTCLTHEGLSAVKLARPLVEALRPGNRAEAWLRALTQLAHAQGLQVVAKGVEHASQAQALRALGVDGLLGLHLAPAMDAESFAAWWRDPALAGPRPPH